VILLHREMAYERESPRAGEAAFDRGQAPEGGRPCRRRWTTIALWMETNTPIKNDSCEVDLPPYLAEGSGHLPWTVNPEVAVREDGVRGPRRGDPLPWCAGGRNSSRARSPRPALARQTSRGSLVRDYV